MNAANAHFHLAVAVFLILLEPPDGRLPKRAVTRGFLALAGLSSPPALFLTPVFLWSAGREKGERRTQAILLCACALVQAGVAFLAPATPRLGVSAGAIVALTKALIRHGLVSPFLGFWIRGVVPGALAAVALGLLSAWVLGWPEISDEQGRRLFAKSIASFALTLFLSMVFSLRMMGGTRYAYVPAVMLAFVFLAISEFGGERALVRARACLAAMVVAGIILFWPNMEPCNRWREWPSWRTEVDRWREDHSERLLIWPQESTEYRGNVWSIRLTTPAGD